MIFTRFARDQRGQDLAEYALALGLLGIALLVVVLIFQERLQLLWNAVVRAVTG